MLYVIKKQLNTLFHSFSSGLSEASSACQTLNTHHYVDLCHSVPDEMQYWHTESVGELAAAQKLSLEAKSGQRESLS